MATSSLTAEQLERIARNRAEAARRMALRQKREMQLGNIRDPNSAGNNYSKIAGTGPSEVSGPGAQALVTSRPESRPQRSPIKVSVTVTVRDENRPVHHPSAQPVIAVNKNESKNLPAESDRSLPKCIVTYRDEQPSTSTVLPAATASAVSFPERRPLVASPVKRHPLITTTFPVGMCTVVFRLVDSKSFQVLFKPFHQSVVTVLKGIKSKKYDPEKRVWFFPIGDCRVVENALQAVKDVTLEIERIPDNVLKIVQSYSKYADGFDEAKLDTNIEKTLLDALFTYQRRGIIHGILHRGRLLLADEMGLGKSIQALGIARYFKSDWPLLIICPSSVKFSWLNQFETFLPNVAEILIIEKGSDRLPERKTNRTVIIMSYDLMVSKRAQLIEYDFKAIIFDESHLLKDSHAQRTRAATDIARKALRVILLTGTPALSRPVELFSQIRIIDSKIFPNYRDFAIRYCDGKQGKFSFEAKGCTNSEELAAILTNSVMLRRLKKDVLNDLPEKRQEVVYLKDDSIYSNIAKLRAAKAAFNGAKDKDTKHQRLVEYYYETGIAKARSVTRYIIDNYFYDGAPQRKVLVFAHHQVVLDTISMDIAKKGLRSIRIDGATVSRSRDEQCRLFQENDDVLVAVLSLTAAGIGITLTAASVVVFAELHWNPGTLKQAEDRAHRVGQKDSVFVQYLIATGTADDVLWPLIQKKLDVLQSCKLSVDTYRGAESVQTTMSPEGGLEDYFPKSKKIRCGEE